MDAGLVQIGVLPGQCSNRSPRRVLLEAAGRSAPVPLDSGPLNGMDALLSTVQMPGGIPVASVAIGKAGASNAAYLAAQIMALNNNDIAVRLREERENNIKNIAGKNESLQNQLKKK